MPTFVIFQMGQQPRTATFDADGVRIGRDESNDLILTGRGVSREHALIYKREAGDWMAWCASDKNPVVVDGAMLRGDADISEGTEILIGPETLLVFCLTEAKARSQMGQKGLYAAFRCNVCDWQGMLSTARQESVCPSCSALDVERTDTWSQDDSPDEIDDSETEFIDKSELKGALQRLRAAKRSRLERIDGKETLKQATDLSETEATRITSKADSPLELSGLIIGGGVEISWTGTRFMVRSQLTFPALKVNGAKVKKAAPVQDGDVLEIGNNRFKMVTG